MHFRTAEIGILIIIIIEARACHAKNVEKAHKNKWSYSFRCQIMRALNKCTRQHSTIEFMRQRRMRVLPKISFHPANNFCVGTREYREYKMRAIHLIFKCCCCCC